MDARAEGRGNEGFARFDSIPFVVLCDALEAARARGAGASGEQALRRRRELRQRRAVLFGTLEFVVDDERLRTGLLLSGTRSAGTTIECVALSGDGVGVGIVLLHGGSIPNDPRLE
jgi:hypothetical protein